MTLTATDIENQRAELTRLRADLEKAKEALRPFATSAPRYAKCKPHRPLWTVLDNIKDGERDLLIVDDLRTAARTLYDLENSK